MQHKDHFRRGRPLILSIVAAACALAWQPAQAAIPPYKVIYRFTDGASPHDGPVADKAGNLFGTTSSGGKYGAGTVWELVNKAGVFTFHVLHDFNPNSATDGSVPYAGVTLDAAGDIFGTTFFGGRHVCTQFGLPNEPCGTVFELIPNATKTLWTEKMLHLFGGGADGAGPETRIVLDAAGNIFATTLGENIPADFGTLFELQRPSTPDGKWVKKTIYKSPGGAKGGTNPNSPPAFFGADPANGIAIMNYAGGSGCGGLYYAGCGGITYIDPAVTTPPPETVALGQLYPGVFPRNEAATSWNARRIYDGLWTVAFSVGVSQTPQSDALASAPNCGAAGCWLLFSTTAPSSKPRPKTPVLLHTFSGGSDGTNPNSDFAQMILGGVPTLFGTARNGGLAKTCEKLTKFAGCGVVASVPVLKGSPLKHGVYSVIHRFGGGADGAIPIGGFATVGKYIYGATQGTAFNSDYGTIYRVGPIQ